MEDGASHALTVALRDRLSEDRCRGARWSTAPRGPAFRDPFDLLTETKLAGSDQRLLRNLWGVGYRLIDELARTAATPADSLPA